jgi:hypothetical protein
MINPMLGLMLAKARLRHDHALLRKRLRNERALR